jgi:hypothetical protein
MGRIFGHGYRYLDEQINNIDHVTRLRMIYIMMNVKSSNRQLR